ENGPGEAVGRKRPRNELDGLSSPENNDKGDDEGRRIKRGKQLVRGGAGSGRAGSGRMHPRNLYRELDRSFEELASAYPPLLEVLDHGMVRFSDPTALRIFTQALFAVDFGLRVELPPAHLCPTLPSRLNYLLWLEDLVESGREVQGRDSKIWALDIGVGASVVYPLLGATALGWSFVGTEVDSNALEVAKANVAANADVLEAKGVETVLVAAASENELLQPAMEAEGAPAMFGVTLTNPPFFDEPMDAGSCIGSATELATAGGEVGFVARLVMDSVVYRARAVWFTSLIGIKASLAPLLDLLHHGLPFAVRVVHTALYQGRTTRWAIGWSFVAADGSPVPAREPGLPARVVPVQLDDEGDEKEMAVLTALSAALTTLNVAHELEIDERRSNGGGGDDELALCIKGSVVRRDGAAEHDDGRLFDFVARATPDAASVSVAMAGHDAGRARRMAGFFDAFVEVVAGKLR
ncbi:uncharacterized protein AMSG_01651, partial [Thecamonas trahens ATCC 50062]